MGVKTNIEVVLNTVPRYMYSGKVEKQEIQNDIVKPNVLYNGSPTHYSNAKKMKGDLNNAWSEWVLKAVKEDKYALQNKNKCISIIHNNTYDKTKSLYDGLDMVNVDLQ